MCVKINTQQNKSEKEGMQQNGSDFLVVGLLTWKWRWQMHQFITVWLFIWFLLLANNMYVKQCVAFNIFYSYTLPAERCSTELSANIMCTNIRYAPIKRDYGRMWLCFCWHAEISGKSRCPISSCRRRIAVKHSECYALT